jgi:hypothetical protein
VRGALPQPCELHIHVAGIDGEEAYAIGLCFLGPDCCQMTESRLACAVGTPPGIGVVRQLPVRERDEPQRIGAHDSIQARLAQDLSQMQSHQAGLRRPCPHVRLWHLADIDADAEHVRFQG